MEDDGASSTSGRAPPRSSSVRIGKAGQVRHVQAVALHHRRHRALAEGGAHFLERFLVIRESPWSSHSESLRPRRCWCDVFLRGVATDGVFLAGGGKLGLRRRSIRLRCSGLMLSMAAWASWTLGTFR